MFCAAGPLRYELIDRGCAGDDDAEGNGRHLEKRGARWQIDPIKFNLKYIDGNLNLENS